MYSHHSFVSILSLYIVFISFQELQKKFYIYIFLPGFCAGFPGVPGALVVGAILKVIS